MENVLNVQRIQPSSFDLFVGMDVDKKSIVMTTVNHDEIIKTQKIPYDADNIVGYFSKRYEGKKIAFVYEAGPTGFGLWDKLVSKGFTCLIAPISSLPITPGCRVKTNRIDSKNLAESLRGGQIHGIRVPSKPYRTLRHLVKTRDTFVKQLKATKCRIKALLLFENLPFPITSSSSEKKWPSAVLCQLRNNKDYERIRFKLDRLLDTFDFAHRQVIMTLQEIRRFCRSDTEISKNIEYVMSIPGIGWIIASEMLARIGDWRLLKNCRELGSFLGFTPREYSTGEEIRRGRITKKGPERIRDKIIEGSWTAIKIDGEMRQFYYRIYRRHPRAHRSQKAITAVARKLTCRIYRVLKDQRNYEVRVPVVEKIQIGRPTKTDNGREGHLAPGDDSSAKRTTGEKRYILV